MFNNAPIQFYQKNAISPMGYSNNVIFQKINYNQMRFYFLNIYKQKKLPINNLKTI